MSYGLPGMYVFLALIAIGSVLYCKIEDWRQKCS